MTTSILKETRNLMTAKDLVLLTITIGDAQAGGSYVVLKFPDGHREKVSRNTQGQYPIPVREGVVLNCVTTVQDINLSTNRTTVIHRFDHAEPAEHICQETVNNQNDKVIYDISYTFNQA